jgi:N-methylhydantoinase A
MMRVATDIGGTFTDIVTLDEQTGELREAKALSTPRNFALGVLDAFAGRGVSPEAASYFVHGSTIVINAITERKGVPTALVTTAGFRDVLEIGRGNRPDMYNLQFRKPAPFVRRALRFEVRERVAIDGTVRQPLQLVDLQPVIEACRRHGVQAIAICFLHAYAYPEHERQAAEALRAALPGVTVSASHEVVREWREFERSSTVVLTAYVMPILDRYLGDLETRLTDQGLAAGRYAMLSNGGVATFEAAARQPIQLVESGPAAGVIGAAIVGQMLDEPNVISLDIGGTTAKCSLLQDGQVTITTDYFLERTPISPGYPLRVPVVDIVEIGAGGGSIAWFDAGGALRIGPVSAGADPGPACYGHGGTEPTVTDAMLVAGVINPDYFNGGRLPVSVERARTAIASVAKRMGTSIEAAANGIIRLVNANMIDALKLVSVRRGYDPRDFTLVAFGGGGPMHAAALARDLRVKRLVVPRYPGTFSAWGMLMSEPRVDLAQTQLVPLSAATPGMLADVLSSLQAAAERQLIEQGFPAERHVHIHEFSIDMRYHGQEHTVAVAVRNTPAGLTRGVVAAAFHDAHRRAYTFSLLDTPIECVTFRVASRTSVERQPASAATAGATPRPKAERLVDFDTEGRHRASIFERADLPPGWTADGPLVVEEPTATTVTYPDQALSVDRYGNLIIELTR